VAGQGSASALCCRAAAPPARGHCRWGARPPAARGPTLMLLRWPLSLTPDRTHWHSLHCLHLRWSSISTAVRANHDGSDCHAHRGPAMAMMLSTSASCTRPATVRGWCRWSRACSWCGRTTIAGAARCWRRRRGSGRGERLHGGCVRSRHRLGIQLAVRPCEAALQGTYDCSVSDILRLRRLDEISRLCHAQQPLLLH